MESFSQVSPLARAVKGHAATLDAPDQDAPAAPERRDR
jgi:hypothetical protein